MTWSSVNASSCAIVQDYLTYGYPGGFKDPAPLFGSESVTLSNILGSKQGYTLTCKNNSNNTKSDSVVINVSTASAPTVALKANGHSGSVTLSNLSQVGLSWTSTNANTCTASGDWSGSKSTSGSETVSSYGKTSLNFSLSCAGATGTGTSSVKVVNQNFADAYVGQPCAKTSSYSSMSSCPTNYFCRVATETPPSGYPTGTCEKGSGGGGVTPPTYCDGVTYTPKNSACLPPLCGAGQRTDGETGLCVAACYASCFSSSLGTFAIGCDGMTPTKCPKGTRTVKGPTSQGIAYSYTQTYIYACRKTYTTKYVYSPASGVSQIKTLSGSECYDQFKK